MEEIADPELYFHSSALFDVLAQRLLLSNAVDSFDTALDAAIYWGNAPIAVQLVSRGANVHTRGQKCGNLLCAASSKGLEKIVDALLASGAEIESRQDCSHSYDYDCTPLQCACSYGHYDVAVRLLSHEADVNARAGELSGTALSCAARSGSLDLFKLLYEAGASPAQDSRARRSLLEWAAGSGSLALVEYLMATSPFREDCASTVTHTTGALTCAALDDQADMVQFLFSKGAHVDLEDWSHGTALTHAIEHNNLELAQFLLEHGASLEKAKGNRHSPVTSACFHAGLPMVKLLVEAGASVTTDANPTESALSMALFRLDQKEMIPYLLEHGADPNMKMEGFPVPLLAAVEKGWSDVVALLFSYGAVPTPNLCKWAVRTRDPDMLRLVIENGALINHADMAGTPLACASCYGGLDIVKLLVEKGANINASNGDLGTPLQAAVAGEKLENVRFLLDQGADCSSGNNEFGYRCGTALELAQTKGYGEIAILLEKHAAQPVPASN